MEKAWNWGKPKWACTLISLIFWVCTEHMATLEPVGLEGGLGHHWLGLGNPTGDIFLPR